MKVFCQLIENSERSITPDMLADLTIDQVIMMSVKASRITGLDHEFGTLGHEGNVAVIDSTKAATMTFKNMPARRNQSYFQYIKQQNRMVGNG